MSSLKCPECAAPMVLRKTTKFKTRDGRPRAFYGCSQFPYCKGTHGAHPDGTPLGVPADLETKRIRMAAHRAAELVFGSWDTKSGRDGFYNWLKSQAHLKKHVAEMDKSEALDVISTLLTERKITSDQSERILEECLSIP